MNFFHVVLTYSNDSCWKSSWIWYSWVSRVGTELNILMGPCFYKALSCCLYTCVLRLSWLREMGLHCSHLFHEFAGCVLVWLFVWPLSLYKIVVIKMLHNMHNVTVSHYWLTLRYTCIVQRGLLFKLVHDCTLGPGMQHWVVFRGWAGWADAW